MASQLICELPEDEIETKILQNWLLLARKDPESINLAIEGFQSFSDQKLEASLTGICAGFVLLKKPQAKNQLKRLSNSKWTSFNFEHLEKGYLILGKPLSLIFSPLYLPPLAGLHLQNGKASLARDACDVVLKQNSGSWRALELKGISYEMERDEVNTIQFFKQAWEKSYGNNPAIGYRLSQSLLNSKQAVEAIDVCHHVLKVNNYYFSRSNKAIFKVNPDYPRIRDQIMIPARKLIRT